MRLLLAAVLSLAAAPALAQTAGTPPSSLTVPADPIIHGAIEGFLRPNFHAFATATSAFKDATAALCSTPSATALTGAQNAFKTAALAYARVEFMRLGPLDTGDRADRILFWPDPKGIALKQVQAALGTQDASVLTPDTLKPKSVAMQGLVAAEFLLFGTGSDALASAGADGTFRCGYVKAVTALIDGLAQTIDAEWQDAKTGPSVEMFNPKPDGQNYRSADEVVQKLTQQLSVGNETIRDQRLMPVLGEAEGAPKPKSALFWRSGLSMAMVGADLAGLHDYFVAANLVQALGQSGHASVSNSVLFEYATAAQSIAKVKSPIDVALADPDQLTHFKELVFVTRSLDTLLAQNMPDALGLTNGFSLLDGD